VAGEGTPIVFFQQTASSSRMYEKVMQQLPPGRALYALDTPGFGGSFDPPASPPWRNTPTGCWRRSTRSAWPLPHFGHHTGACLAVELGVRHAARVASLMMVGPLPLTPEERHEFSLHFGAPIAPTADGSYLKATWDYLATLGAHRDLDLHHRELDRHHPRLAGSLHGLQGGVGRGLAALFAAVRCPMLLLCATDDVLYPSSSALKTLRPDASAVVIKGAKLRARSDAAGTVAAMVGFLAGARARGMKRTAFLICVAIRKVLCNLVQLVLLNVF
jgi:pimeloyl-ACP methyl ester carboxylesterase